MEQLDDAEETQNTKSKNSRSHGISPCEKADAIGSGGTVT